MKNTYFLDTSYIIALEIKNENSHQQVLQNWRTLASAQPFLVTTTYIFDEVVTFFNSRKLHHKAVEIGNRLLESPDIELIEINHNLFSQGWEYFQKYQDIDKQYPHCHRGVLGIQRVLGNRRWIVPLNHSDPHFRERIIG